MGLRDKVSVIASGKVASGFDMVTKIALGADACNAARAMLFALGCIQARRCHTNSCPTGITTQDPSRKSAVHIHERGPMVASYHDRTIHAFLEMCGAMGLKSIDDLTPDLIMRRGANEISIPYSTLYEYLEPGILLTKNIPATYKQQWECARADQF